MRYIILQIFTLLLTSTIGYAQLNPMMYSMNELTQRNQLNPAFQPKNGSVYVGFPFLGSLLFEGQLTGKYLNLGTFLGDSPNYRGIAMAQDPYSQVQAALDINLINVGVVINNMYFTLDNKVRGEVSGRAPKDLRKLMWLGNGHDEVIGKKMSMANMGAEVIAYNETALGVAVPLLDNQLTVGGKVKYLRGLAYVDGKLEESSYLHTDKSNYKVTVGLNADMYMSGVLLSTPDGQFPLDSLSGSTGTYDPSSGGNGFGFDLGAEWNVPMVKGLTVSASVLNLGSNINWKGTEIRSVDKDQKIEFEGIDLEGGDNFFNSLLDSIGTLSTVEASTSKKRRVKIRPTLYLGASYDLHKYVNVAAVYGYQGGAYTNTSMFALSANAQNFMVNPSIAYSYIGGKSNLGLGAVFGRRALQFHLVIDNILALNYKKARYANARLGLNFLFGKSKQERLELAGTNGLLVPTQVDSSINTQENVLKETPEIEQERVDPASLSTEEEDPVILTRFMPSEPSTPKESTAAMTDKELLLKRAMEEEIEDQKRNMP
ncbi:MAG: DUF5723 family protein [Bacteroidales bacterium]